MPEYTGRSSSSTLSTGNSSNRNSAKCSNSMRLFGLPYQFIDTVDPRMDDVSGIIGKNFIEKVITDAPTVMLIPGKAKFLPGNTNKQGTSHALLEAANGNIGPLITGMSGDVDDVLRYYDFEEDYTTYMKYVNSMCRTVAVFLELKEQINGQSLQSFDWRDYRWNADKYHSGALSLGSYAWNSFLNTLQHGGGAFFNSLMGNTVDMRIDDTHVDPNENNSTKIQGTSNFVQFYVDPSSGSSQSLANSTSASQIKSAMDTASSAMKEFQFVANSAGIGMEGLNELTDSGLDALAESLGGGNGQFSTVMNQLLSAGKSVIKGENIILPEVYQGSDYGIDYTIDIHLRSPYGNKYSIFIDVLVPLLHLIALCMPKQSTSNTYGSPFLIKAYYPGVFNCNLGIVESLQITKPSSEDAYSIDGLPMEVDVQLRIKDLYSDLSMSPSNEVELFRNNTSLIDYLATLSGLDLIAPMTDLKTTMMITTYAAGLRDIGDNAASIIYDKIEKTFIGFTTL